MSARVHCRVRHVCCPRDQAVQKVLVRFCHLKVSWFSEKGLHFNLKPCICIILEDKPCDQTFQKLYNFWVIEGFPEEK